MSGLRRLLVAACVVGGGLLAGAPGAAAAGLNWKPCAFADAGSQCATAHVPRDYDHPNGDKLSIDVAKSPATGPGKKIGSLFFNFGGPGAFAAPYVEFVGHDLFPVLNERFDIVGMDPRGTGTSAPGMSAWSVAKCCSASVSVGAISAAWAPDSTARSIA